MLDVSLKNTKTNYGSGATMVSVNNGNHSFSFLLRDVTMNIRFLSRNTMLWYAGLMIIVPFNR